MTTRRLLIVLRWLAVILILRVLISIIANYADYFPPNFEADFLIAREAMFDDWYRIAFYLHIVSSPYVLVNGLLLLNHRFRSWSPRGHRFCGWVQAVVVLLLVLPSGFAMAFRSYAGPAAGASFVVLAVVTGVCVLAGVSSARHRQFDRHRRWMWRSYVLICSAITLRLISGALSAVPVADANMAYVFASWASWIVPGAILECVFLIETRTQFSITAASSGIGPGLPPRGERLKS